jgi:peptide/nickel transport system substrate-binding protein
MPRSFAAAILLLPWLITTLGCARSEPTPAERTAQVDHATPPYGGSLIGTIRSEPMSFNRYVSRDVSSDLVSQLINARLVRLDRRTDQLEPWLAERWETTAGDLMHRLYLRRDVFFSDGAPFTSADVVFSFRALNDPPTPLGQAILIEGKPITVEAEDSHTVVVRFPSRFAPGLRLLDAVPMLPAHKLAPAHGRGEFQKAWGLSTPPADLAGLGAFVLDEYTPGQRLVFRRNPRYWRKDDKGRALPYLDRLTLEVAPDQNAEGLRLEAGQADFTQSEARPQDLSAFRRAEAEGRLRLIDLGIGLDADMLWFNLTRAKAAAEPHRRWLQREELRRAVSLAVDRRAFVDAVYRGAATPISGPVTPASRWFAPGLPEPAYDPAAAAALLDALDLRDRNGDGLRDDASGRTASVTLSSQQGNTARERAASVVQESLRRIGLQVNLSLVDAPTLGMRAGKGDYDAIYFGFLAPDVDPARNLEFWLSSGAFHAWNPGQKTPDTEWEAEIDRLMLAQARSSDEEERRRLFHQAQRLFAQHLPAVYFAAPNIVIAASPRIAHMTPARFRPQILWNPDTLAAAPDSR